MARQLRIEFSGAYYHVFSRGNNRADIFCSDKDRRVFLDLLEILSERFAVEIHAYVLMDNHYHLLLRTLEPNLSNAMQWLGTTYTLHCNTKNSKTGHLFQGRFKSILVENDQYLTQLSFYIHRNPLRAGLAGSLAEFKWSSYHYYVYPKTPPPWLKTDLILSMFHSHKDPHKAYRSAIKQYAEQQSSPVEEIRHGFIYGSEKFADFIKDRYLAPQQQDTDLPHLNRVLRSEAPDSLAEKLADLLNCDIQDFKNRARLAGQDRDKRDVMIYALWETSRYSNPKIGELVGLSYSAVSKRIHDARSKVKSSGENRVKQIYEELMTRIKI
ncbi:MAG: transposase [Desulfobacteraceae bacterium]|nr:transposase [Desulfobacteraceae bacterium]